MNYKDWLNEWLDLYVKPTSKIQTQKKYTLIIDNHLVPALGEYELKDLTAARLQKFTTELTFTGLAPNTVNVILTVLKASLRKAVLMDYVKQEYSNAICRPKHREKMVECFTLEEQKKIEAHIIRKKGTKYVGILLALYTGLRIGELLALKWSDLDFRTGFLNVTKSCYDSWIDGRYKKTIDTPKTASSVRQIPLPRQIIPYLIEVKSMSPSEYVVMGRLKEEGAEIRSYQRTFKNLLNQLEIPHRGFHSLRHTFATRALECGMDVKTLSEILGHRDPSVTLQRYAHSLMEHKVEMMNRLGRLFE